MKNFIKVKILLVILVFCSCSAQTPESSNRANLVLLTNDWSLNETNFSINTEQGDWLESSEYLDINDAFSADTVARSFQEDEAWFLDRVNHSVSKVRFSDSGSPYVVSRWMLENNPNPHDLWLSNEIIYITQYENESLLMLNSADGQEVGQINLSDGDLSGCAQNDGKAEMDQIFMKNNKIYISMQCLDTTGSWNPVSEGKLAVLDASTNSILEIITLTDCFNPVDASENPSGDYLYFSCVGNYDAGNDDSIIKMKYADHSIQKIADESLFGGDIGGITIKNDENIFVTVTAADWSQTWVSKVNVNNNQAEIIHQKSTPWHNRIAFKNETLWLIGNEGLYSISDCGLFCTDEQLGKSSGNAAQLLFWLGDPMFGGGGH